MGSTETWMLDGKGEVMEITNASVAMTLKKPARMQTKLRPCRNNIVPEIKNIEF